MDPSDEDLHDGVDSALGVDLDDAMDTITTESAMKDTTDLAIPAGVEWPIPNDLESQRQKASAYSRDSPPSVAPLRLVALFALILVGGALALALVYLLVRVL